MSRAPSLLRIAMRGPQSTLADGVVVLRPPELGDVPLVMAWDADPEIQRWFDWPLTPPLDDADTFAARRASAERTVRSQWAQWEAGDAYTFVVRWADGDEGVGWLDLQPRGQGRGNVAYGVLADHRRRGAASRAVVLATRFAFDVLCWARLELRANVENVGSRGVADRAGYRLDGIMRSSGLWEKYQPMIGRRFDEALYSRLPEDGD
jgi:RimJ/RimL family protein N-acetyltransferase